MSSDYYWMAYKWFYNPPGLPQDLRCVGCKYTAAAGLLGVSGLCASKAYNIINPRPYLGMTFALTSVFSLLSVGVAVRLALEDQKYNEQRIKEHAAEVKRQRREKTAMDKKQLNA